MASIIGKKKHNQTYYYVVTSGRVDGKPRITRQTYLGTAERLARLVRDKSAPVPLEAVTRDAGLPTALWHAARRSGTLDALLSVWPAPAKGPSIPHFLLLAAFHRICVPGPMTDVADWYRNSILADLWGFSHREFSPQAFERCLDAMAVEDGSPEPRPDDLQRAQLALLQAFRTRQLVSRHVLVYDITNFHTWIAAIDACQQSAQGGRDGQNRDDLRQFGLCYAMDGQHGLSLCHRVYPGHLTDGADVPTCLGRVTRLLDGAGIPRETVTLVLDRDSVAPANTLALQASGLGWITALPWDQAPTELRSLPVGELEALGADESGVSVAAERLRVQGGEYLGVMCHSAGLAAEQFQSLGTSLAKATESLRRLAWEISRPQDRHRHTEQDVRRHVGRWLRPNGVAQVLTYELQRLADRSWELRFAVDTDAVDRLLAERLGRTILVTNRVDWTGAEVARAYHGQRHVERVLRGQPGGEWLDWEPPHPGTDRKIRVHAFCRLVGISLLRYLRREAGQVWPNLTVEELQHELGQIQQIDLRYRPLGKKGPPRVATVTSKQSSTQTSLITALQLDELLETDRG